VDPVEGLAEKERAHAQGAGCRVQGAGCRVQGAGCRVQGGGRVPLLSRDRPQSDLYCLVCSIFARKVVMHEANVKGTLKLT